MRIFMTLVPACLLVAGCSSEQATADDSSDTGMTAAAGSGVPPVAEAYRSSLDDAWRKAGEGTSPSGACAGVVGQATTVLNNADVAAEDRADATAALDACYVRSMVRFVDTTLSIENPGPQQCISLLRALPVHRSSLGSFFEGTGEDLADYDKRLTDLVGEQVRSTCPDNANTILGG